MTSSQRLFLFLIQAGWIIKNDGQYQLTPIGIQKGGKYETGGNGSSWITWPLSIIHDPLMKDIPEGYFKASTKKHTPETDQDNNESNIEIAPKLDRLTKLHQATVSSRAEYEARKEAIANKIQAELEALDAEYAPLFEALGQQESQLQDEIKDDVRLYGRSVEGNGVKATYVKGRVTWNTKELNEYAETHPEILPYRKEGSPSVRIQFKIDKFAKKAIH
jgi:hypothetical protein